MNPEQIARVTHEANRAYCAAIGDNSQKSWDEADQWQRDSAVKGVSVALANPEVTPEQLHESWTPEQLHESWTAQKLADGWEYGPVKDADKKQHPCLVPYGELPPQQQRKDALFRGVVLALRPSQTTIESGPVGAARPDGF